MSATFPGSFPNLSSHCAPGPTPARLALFSTSFFSSPILWFLSRFSSFLFSPIPFTLLTFFPFLSCLSCKCFSLSSSFLLCALCGRALPAGQRQALPSGHRYGVGVLSRWPALPSGHRYGVGVLSQGLELFFLPFGHFVSLWFIFPFDFETNRRTVLQESPSGRQKFGPGSKEYASHPWILPIHQPFRSCSIICFELFSFRNKSLQTLLANRRSRRSPSTAAKIGETLKPPLKTAGFWGRLEGVAGQNRHLNPGRLMGIIYQ
jgi:hypothetical protein